MPCSIRRAIGRSRRAAAIVPVVQFGSFLGPLVFFAGLLLNLTGLAWVGVALFAGVALFSLVTLPVEFNASHRAKALCKAISLSIMMS